VTAPAERIEMTAPDTADLIERLEAAEAGSRELDALVYAAVTPGDWMATRDGWIEGGGRAMATTKVTQSFDAALALAERVLPGVRVVTDSACKETGKPAAGFVFSQHGEAIKGVMNDGATTALALCAAILRAKESQA